MYYFGARYLDPQISRWISPDPAFEDYLPVPPVDDEARRYYSQLPGMGGVFNPVNINVYHYAGNNTVKYVDPGGEVPILLTLLGFAFGQSLPEPDRPYSEAFDSGMKMAMVFTGIGMLYDAGKSICSMLVAETVQQNDAGRSISSVASTAEQAKIQRVVLGHYKDYIEKAKLGDKTFSAPLEFWDKMIKGEQWAANQKFFDRAIAKGSEFILATPLDKIRPGSFFEKEINYLLKHGYKFTTDLTKLIPSK